MGLYRKIFTLLDRGEKLKFFQIMALSLLVGLAETAGVVSVLPFLALVADPGLIERNGVLRALHGWSGADGPSWFLLYTGIFAITFMVLSAMVRIVNRVAIMRFIAGCEFGLSLKLVEAYLGQPYAWFLSKNTSRLSKTVLTEVGQTVKGAVMPALEAVANAAVALFLIGLLVAVEPLAAVGTAAVVGGLYGLLLLATRRFVQKLGQQRLSANRQRFRVLSEAMGGVKDVKFLGLENIFLDRLRGPARRFAEAQENLRALQEIPRIVLEVLLFGSMIAVVLLFLVRNDGSIQAVLPQLGMFAFAVARLFPRAQILYSNLTTMRNNRPALDALLRDFAATRGGRIPQRTPPDPLPLRERVVLEDVRFVYDGAEQPVLDGLTLGIAVNTTIGLVGTTGAGKTTAVDILLGLLAPQQGRLLVDGAPIDASNIDRWRRSIGYVPQQIFLLDESVAANIAFGIPREQIDMAAVERAARVAELHDFVTHELPQGYDTVVGERGVRLSGGQRQRIGIARALYRDPAVLVLDEATSALDNLTERAVINAVNALRNAKTIVMIAHRLSTVRRCDEIVFLERGRVRARGDYDTLIATDAEFGRLALAS